MDDSFIKVGSFEFSNPFNEIASALSKAQQKFPEPIKNRKNDFFGNRYADFKAVIDTIKPYLSEHGLFVSFSSTIRGIKEVEVNLLILHQSNQFLKTSISMTSGSGAKKVDRNNDRMVETLDTDDANKVASNVTKLARTLLRLTFLQQASDEEIDKRLPTPGNNRKFHPLIEKLESLTKNKYKEKFENLPEQQRAYVIKMLKGAFSDEDIEKNFPAWIQYLEKEYKVFQEKN